MNNNDTPESKRIILDEAGLRAASKALWEAQRKSEIEQVAEFQFDDNLFIRTGEILQNAGPKETVISGFSLMSRCLNDGLRYHLSHSTKKDQSDLLDGLGPLSTDSARMRLVRLMGWLPGIISDGVDAFRRTRNSAAHEIVSDSDIDVLSKMPLSTRDYLNSKILEATTSYIGALEGEYSNPITDFFDKEAPDPRFYALILSADLLECVVCGPGKLRLGLGITPGTFFSSEDAPVWADALIRSTLTAILELMNIHDKLRPC